MDDELRICAYEPCGVEYIKSTHNQKFHSDECCRLATNKRIMEKYYERKARLKGAVRICKTPTCNTKLSRYNASKFCSACERRESDERRYRLMGMMA